MSPHLLQTDVCSFKVSDFFREVAGDLCSASALLWHPYPLLESCYLNSCHSFCSWAVHYTFQNVMSYLMTHLFFFSFSYFIFHYKAISPIFKITLLSKSLSREYLSVLIFLLSAETWQFSYSLKNVEISMCH